MADQKVTQLPPLGTPTNDDLLLVVDTPAGTPISKQVSIGAVLALAAGTGWAPPDAPYLTVSPNPGLSAERSLAVTAPLALADGGANASLTLSLADNGVTDLKLRDSIATSVLGRATGTTGDPGDIQATADNTVLRRAGGVVGFGTLSGAAITAGTLTNAAAADMAPWSVKARYANSFGPPQDLQVPGSPPTGLVLRFNASAREWSVSLGYESLRAGGINLDRLADQQAWSVVGRSPNTSGPVQAILATTNGQVLRMAAGALGFGTLDLGSGQFTNTLSDQFILLRNNQSLRWQDRMGTTTDVMRKETWGGFWVTPQAAEFPGGDPHNKPHMRVFGEVQCYPYIFGADSYARARVFNDGGAGGTERYAILEIRGGTPASLDLARTGVGPDANSR